MKIFYEYLLKSKPLFSCLFFCVIVIILSFIQKIFLFSTGTGDIFYTIFQNFKGLLGKDYNAFDRAFSYLMFLGTFYGVFLKAILYIFAIFIYSSAVQFLLHLLIKKPERFSRILSIFFTNLALLYVLNYIPYLGPFIFMIGFLYLVSRQIGKLYSLSTLAGFGILVTPKIISVIVFFILVFGLINTASLF